jgi:DNA primase
MTAQIEKILKTKSIIGYLEKRGHNPVKEMGAGRKSYLCPFDDHKEIKPSFIVYPGNEYENFFCFGCNRGYSIIHLISYLEHVSFSDALNRLSEGIVVPTEDEIKYIIEKINKDNYLKNPIVDLNKSLFEASWQCLLYTQGTNFNSEEVKIIDDFYGYLDKKIIEGDLDIIEEAVKYLPVVLKKRKHKFQQSLEKRKQKEFYDNLEEIV